MKRPKYPPLHQPPIEEVPCRYIISEWDAARQTTGEIMAMADNAVVAAAAFKAAGYNGRTAPLCCAKALASSAGTPSGPRAHDVHQASAASPGGVQAADALGRSRVGPSGKRDQRG